MRSSENVDFTLSTKPYPEGDQAEESDNFAGRLRASFAKADERIATLETVLKEKDETIATLETVLKEKEGTIGQLLIDDLETCEELAELQAMVWDDHSGAPGGCTCKVCGEVEQSQRELAGII